MKKTLPILLIALTLTCPGALAETSGITLIGGADGPTSIFLSDAESPSAHSVTVSFDANITTGFQWTAAVVGGDSAVIDETAGGYVSDPNPGMMCGVGGHHDFVINAVEPGSTVIRFTYSRGRNEIASERLMLAEVSEDLQIRTEDITDFGTLTGTASEIGAAGQTAVISTESRGEVTAVFPEGMALPAEGEQVCLFTDGTMTLSEPPMVSVIGWESIPGDNARDEAAELPPYVYTGSDPIEGAAADFAIWLEAEIGYFHERSNVTIPAPLILKTEQADEDHVRVWGNFWHLNYTLRGEELVCVSGGEAPGVLELTREGDGWRVSGYEIAGDGEDYQADIERFCGGDKVLLAGFGSAGDLMQEPMKSLRDRFIAEYVNLYQLPVTAYRDEYWEPIYLEK